MILQTINLKKSFGGIQATDGVNLEVEEGQTHAIVGPNGSGKTTLINQLSGVFKPDSGQIIFDGQDITHRPEHQRAHQGIARSFQITSVIQAMTLLENVMLAIQSRSGHSFRFWSRANSDTRLRDQATEYLKAVGLKGSGNVLASEVSHGEHRQLEIAMSIALRPKLLLLDEPTAGMSKEETRRMIDLLAHLKHKITILLIEHDMDAVFALADRVSVLVDGQIIASDNALNIRKNTAVQKAYLGEEYA